MKLFRPKQEKEMTRNETEEGSTDELWTASDHACSTGCADFARDGVRANFNAGLYCQAHQPACAHFYPHQSARANRYRDTGAAHRYRDTGARSASWLDLVH